MNQEDQHQSNTVIQEKDQAPVSDNKATVETKTPSKEKRKPAIRHLPLKIAVAVFFAGMVIVNALASILPINGQDTGAISDAYPNLFAPAGITFAIWRLIYLLLALFTVFQFFTPVSQVSQDRLTRLQILFIISSAANIAWIFSWHYMQIGLSLIFMLIILLTLILSDRQVSKQPLKLKEKLCLKLPFSVYFGWISVATVANVTTLLVDIGWDGAGLPDHLWMVLIIIIATLIALSVVTSRLNWAYGAVFVWAYIGILIKHLDPAIHNAQYIYVIITVSVSLGLIAAASLLALFGRSMQLAPKVKAEK